MARPLLLALLCLYAFPLNADAQRPGALKELRKNFSAQVAAAQQKPDQDYFRKLSNLEKLLVETRDYKSAAAVREKREELKNKLSKLEGQESPIITLPVSSASPFGGAKIDKETGTIRGFSSKSAGVRWTFPALIAAGGYEVELHLEVPESVSGTIELKGKFHSIEREISSDPSSQKKMVFKILRLREGTNTFSISVQSVSGGDLFALKSARLKPVSAE